MKNCMNLACYRAHLANLCKRGGAVNSIEEEGLILPVLEGHSVKRVYSLTEVFDDNENNIKQDQAASFEP